MKLTAKEQRILWRVITDKLSIKKAASQLNITNMGVYVKAYNLLKANHTESCIPLNVK